MISFRLTAAFVLASASVAAQAEMVRPQDPLSLVRVMKAHGYAAELTVDATGDPMIKSNMNGTNYQILFYNCTAHKECATVQFYVGYHLKASPSLELINEWGRTQRFGHAYLDKENDPILAMDVDLDDGGVGEMLFIDNLEFWSSSMTRFEKHIGFRS